MGKPLRYRNGNIERKGGEMAHKERHIRIRSIRRDPPDLRKLSRALIELARAQQEADSRSEHGGKSTEAPPSPPEAA
jgi:hypothetical protein